MIFGCGTPLRFCHWFLSLCSTLIFTNESTMPYPSGHPLIPVPLSLNRPQSSYGLFYIIAIVVLFVLFRAARWPFAG